MTWSFHSPLKLACPELIELPNQMVALLTLMKEMGILDETHYEEFRAYLMHSLTSQSNKS